MKIKLLKGFIAGIFAIIFVCVGFIVKQGYYEHSEQNRLRASIDFSLYQETK